VNKGSSLEGCGAPHKREGNTEEQSRKVRSWEAPGCREGAALQGVSAWIALLLLLPSSEVHVSSWAAALPPALPTAPERTGRLSDSSR
jgi:hypothetical protein